MKNIFQHLPSNRLIRALLDDNHEKCKVRGLSWQGNSGWPNTGKYWPRNNQSDFKISGLGRRISTGHIIMFLPAVPCRLLFAFLERQCQRSS